MEIQKRRKTEALSICVIADLEFLYVCAFHCQSLSLIMASPYTTGNPLIPIIYIPKQKKTGTL